MSDYLRERLGELVADPPPPTTVPSMAVFARVRTARRRRAAGAAVVAAAAAVAVFAVSGNLNDSKSEPPVLAPPPTPVQTTPPPYDVTVTLKPVVKGRTVTMNISATGTVLLPIAAGGLELPAQNLMALGQGSAYSWGDDSEPFSAFSNGTECVKAKTPYKGTGTVPADTHTYARPGIYIYTYRAKFCGMKESATATTQIQIK